MYLFKYLFMYLFKYLFIYLFMHLFMYVVFIYLFIYLFTVFFKNLRSDWILGGVEVIVVLAIIYRAGYVKYLS